VDDIPIGRACRPLHFLCATVGGSPPGTRVGSFTLLHSSGRADELPLVFGRNISGCWSEPITRGPEWPTPVWTGENPETRAGGCRLELFEAIWANPTPADPVASVSFSSSLEDPAPFLLAITAE
jgi:hypothetical protein